MAKNTTEVVEFLLSLGQSASLVLDDGELTLSDAHYIFDCLRRLGPAVGNITLVDDEIKAWTDEDTKELNALAEQFDIPQENIEAAVKHAIGIASSLVGFFAKFRTV